MSLFVATADRGEHPAELASWSRHLTGTVHVHPIACRHDELTSPGALQQIGQQIATVLAERLR